MSRSWCKKLVRTFKCRRYSVHRQVGEDALSRSPHYSSRFRSLVIWGFYQRGSYASSGIARGPMSVCPSVTLRYCIKTKKASIIISSRSEIPNILVFGNIRIISKFERVHPKRGRFMRLGGYELAILLIFRPISHGCELSRVWVVTGVRCQRYRVAKMLMTCEFRWMNWRSRWSRRSNKTTAWCWMTSAVTSVTWHLGSDVLQRRTTNRRTKFGRLNDREEKQMMSVASCSVVVTVRVTQ